MQEKHKRKARSNERACRFTLLAKFQLAFYKNTISGKTVSQHHQRFKL